MGSGSEGTRPLEVVIASILNVMEYRSRAPRGRTEWTDCLNHKGAFEDGSPITSSYFFLVQSGLYYGVMTANNARTTPTRSNSTIGAP